MLGAQRGTVPWVAAGIWLGALAQGAEVRASFAEVAKLLASDRSGLDYFGWSVSVCGDRIAAAAPGADAVYVFDWDGARWVESAKLVPAEPGDALGDSVSLSGDRVVSGGVVVDGIGAAHVFEWDGARWAQTAKLLASSGTLDDFFGISVALSADRIVVGAPWDDDATDSDIGNAGAAYVFDWDGTSWVETAKLLPSDGSASDYFGQSVSVWGDRIVVGAYLDEGVDRVTGAAYLFEWDGATWAETARLTANDGAYRDHVGISVSQAGDRIAVGAPEDDDAGIESGSAYVFDWDGTGWVQTAKLTATDGAAFDEFGGSVALYGDRLAVGATFKDYLSSGGATYVFEWDGTGWSETAKLVASDGASFDEFGFSVALSDDWIVVGARNSDDKGTNSGSAYVFSELLFADDFEDGVAPTDWRLERGTWEESGGSLNGVPDDRIGTQVKARAIADPAFAGCGVCRVQATLTSANSFGQPAEIHVRLLSWYADKETNVAVTLKPEQDKVVFRQKEAGATLFRRAWEGPVEEETPYEVTIDFDGETFRVSLDGVPLFEEPNAASGPLLGTVGVQSRNVDIRVDEVAVFP